MQALWVQPETGEVYRIPDAAWASLRGGALVLSRPDGQRRRARPGRLRAFALGPAEGAQALLAESGVQDALFGLLVPSVPGEGRWLMGAALAPEAEDFVAALEGAGSKPDPAARLSALGAVLEGLDGQGGAQRLGELAAQAARAASVLAPETPAPSNTAPLLALLAAVLGRAARADPTWRPTAAPEEDLTAATRAHVSARLAPPTAPSFSYADLLGREPGALPKRDDETD